MFKLLVKWGYIGYIIRGLIGLKTGLKWHEIGKGMQICDLVAGRNNLITGRNKGDRAGNWAGRKSCRVAGRNHPPYGPQ